MKKIVAFGRGRRFLLHGISNPTKPVLSISISPPPPGGTTSCEKSLYCCRKITWVFSPRYFCVVISDRTLLITCLLQFKHGC